jgi:RadC-like JAB domain
MAHHTTDSGESGTSTRTVAIERLHHSTFNDREAALIAKAMRLIEERRLRGRQALNYFEDFQRYLVLRFAGLTNEQAHVLYLDIDRRLLAADVIYTGDHKSVAGWDARQMLVRAISLGAEHVVFAHNHPNENPNPSDDDVRHLTHQEHVLATLGLNVLESYVVTSAGITSIKAERQRRIDAETQRRRAAEDQRSAQRRAKLNTTRAAKAAARHQAHCHA